MFFHDCVHPCTVSMGLLPDTQNYVLRMRRKCRERFPRHRLQRIPLVNDPGMHHGTCVTHVPWCMSGSLNHSGRENVPGIPAACATRDFAYLVRGPSRHQIDNCNSSAIVILLVHSVTISTEWTIAVFALFMVLFTSHMECNDTLKMGSVVP